MDNKITSEVISLKTPEGHYLAQVIITSNHGLYVDSDYGSFVYRWGETSENFKAFLLRISSDYLITKIESELSYIFNSLTKKQQANLERTVNKVFPVLQDYLKHEEAANG